MKFVSNFKTRRIGGDVRMSGQGGASDVLGHSTGSENFLGSSTYCELRGCWHRDEKSESSVKFNMG